MDNFTLPNRNLARWRYADGSAPRHGDHWFVQGRLVTCIKCGDVTWARGPDSETLQGWRGKWPDRMRCPQCK